MSTIPPEVNRWQRHLLRAATQKIECAYLRALEQGMSDPAVFVLDLNDPTAWAICRASGRNRESRRVLRQARKTGSVPIAVWHMPAPVAATLLPPDQVSAANLLRNWDRDGRTDLFPVVLVAAGATALVALPTTHLRAARR